MSNIGIMGGTFDPIHNGHLLLGKQAYLEYNLDYIWFMPSGQPPHKKNRHVTDSVHRWHYRGNQPFCFQILKFPEREILIQPKL